MANMETVRFKGTRQGVNLHLEPQAEFQEVLTELDQRLKGTDQFFRSASVMLNLGDRKVDDSQFTALREVLARYGLLVISVEASHMDTRSLCRGMGLQVELPAVGPAGVLAELQPALNGESGARSENALPHLEEAVVVHRTLRSGQTLEAPGDICVIGDVNPGAEVVAGDNVIVWGSLRGVVRAGTRTNTQAVVCALELAPTQLRIASVVTRQPETSDMEVVPEMARIVDGQIIVEQWIPRSRRSRVR